ncbi:MAG: triose-phosphate isomerase [Nitrososphaeria archaeon]|nr:triose-phosphate isomerase [Aigarchaeota archaeon]MCX8187680.1 triose-phosphate isomerase [Nitrososphaeria archaeon]MDW8021841.1 triose-phosphate isomerase [Nitrososphaerota archaeon]
MAEKLSYPLIALNFKVYLEAIGGNAVRLSKVAEEVSREYDVCIVVAPPQLDLAQVAGEVRIPVFSQHVDPYKPGSYTGSIIAEDVKAAGAIGSIVNHSERRLRLADIGAVLERLRENGLIALLCTDTVETTKAGAALSPDILAIEPPELIGTGIPVSKAKPEVVTAAVEAVKEINPGVHVLCGAGISTGDDVARAIELGTEGVLLASAYVKARDPKKLLSEMAEAALKAWDKR